MPIAACSLLCSCSPTTVWKVQDTSPSGHYTATARTLENSGPGNAWIVTSVYLEQTNIPESRMEVLGFFCKGPVPHPFTLDNAANVGGTIGLQMTWLSPTHLQVTYDGRKGKVEFQAVRFQVIDISLKDLSANVANPPS